MFTADNNVETGRICYDCGQPEWLDDEPFGMRQIESGHFVVTCCSTN